MPHINISENVSAVGWIVVAPAENVVEIFSSSIAVIFLGAKKGEIIFPQTQTFPDKSVMTRNPGAEYQKTSENVEGWPIATSQHCHGGGGSVLAARGDVSTFKKDVREIITSTWLRYFAVLSITALPNTEDFQKRIFGP